VNSLIRKMIIVIFVKD